MQHLSGTEVERLKHPHRLAPRRSLASMDMGLVLAWLSGLTVVLVVVIALA
ncbi:hypothetical protein [Chelatococcus reniformis]|uniref:Uncharacterized protein n=1 Tax=Chelatococcus reniformis TaxID=1494448 RepID=A0A916TYA7_9HYPH|nr:hypothetical protein [Chelatococcus reniformis]GGC50834.1 hypothetical protein GCM10010994_07480 [Chelatococcus reniformis]